jgi:hypothetical protein
MNREVHVRICEGLGVKFPGATRPIAPNAGKGESGRRRSQPSVTIQHESLPGVRLDADPSLLEINIASSVAAFHRQCVDSGTLSDLTDTDSIPGSVRRPALA